MKKILLAFLVMFTSLIVVNASSSYTVDNVRNVINGGDVTKAFEDQVTGEGCEHFINATTSGNTLNIAYKFKCEEEQEKITGGEKKTVKEVTYDVSGNIIMTLEDNILQTKTDIDNKQVKKDPFYGRILSLVPYWGVEMSSRYPQVKKYLDKNHKNEFLATFEKIFDSCYFVEMGVCYSATPGLNQTTYTGRIQMDDKATDYALKYLKKEQRELNTKSMMFKGIILAGILAVLYVFCKSLGGKRTKKPIRY